MIGLRARIRPTVPRNVRHLLFPRAVRMFERNRLTDFSIAFECKAIPRASVESKHPGFPCQADYRKAVRLSVIRCILSGVRTGWFPRGYLR